MIYVACVVAAIGMVGVALAPSPEWAVAAYLPFGLGAGIFLSVDWALMTDVIPKETTGRYMGILNAGTAAAGPVYLIVAGLTLDAFSRGRARARPAGGDDGRGRLPAPRRRRADPGRSAPPRARARLVPAAAA